MTDAVNEIKNSLKPSFRRPYLWVSVQKTLRLRGLYDTGADISCMSEKVFRQLPLNARPKKLDSDKPQKFKSAGGEPLPVRGLYEFNLRIGEKVLTHQFYVIPELNEPLILGIDFIQKHQCGIARKIAPLHGRASPTGGKATSKFAALL